MGYAHQVYNISKLPGNAHQYLPAIHSSAANFKSWFLGTLHRTPSEKHIDCYLAEYAYRFNYRNLPNSGEIFYNLIRDVLIRQAIEQRDIISR
jgi:hypothetical protein